MVAKGARCQVRGGQIADLIEPLLLRVPWDRLSFVMRKIDRVPKIKKAALEK